MEKIEERKNCM